MRKINTYILISFFVVSNIFAQDNSNLKFVKEKHPINLNNIYKLQESNIIPNSESIFLQSSTLKKSDFTINYRTKIISLSDSLHYSIFDTLFVTYSSIDVPIKDKYSNRKLEIRYDDKMQDTIRVIRNELASFSPEAMFGEGIKRSGSISRGFSIGTNQDMKLNSGMRLQFSGKLSSDLEIVAALTDQNIPIQPEGTTERLEELDQVFITIKHPNAAATFGDFEIKNSIGEFGKINRKMQGLEGELFLGKIRGKGILAGSKGKFNTNQFLGSDGNQGPYKLSGINNENLIIIIAGTERVYIDGEELKRGENNDYIIDYSLAEITFTINKLITSASRIVVDFEYSDRQFERNLFGGNASTSFFKDKLKLYVNAFSESDDKNNPIDITLSEIDIKILEQAGNDRNKAVKSGITLVSPDSVGKRVGTYTLRDTLIGGENYNYLIYIPGSDSSKYNANFSFVGYGVGDYTRISVGNYTFVGKGNGEYLPIVFIPMPQKKQIGNFVLEAKPWNNFLISAEFAGSIFDQNIFSEISNNQNYGRAHNIKAEFTKSKIEIGNISFGEVGFSYRERFVEDKFSSLDRYNSVEYNRNYNISNSKNLDETLREVSFVLQPVEILTTKFNYGYLKRGELFNSDRFFGDINLQSTNNYKVNYNYDYVQTKDIFNSSNWFKQNARATYNLGLFTPGFDFLSDNRKEWNSSNDSLNSQSRDYSELGAFVNIAKLFGIDITTKYSIRKEASPINGILEKESISSQQSLNINYREIKELDLSLDFTIRNKSYTDKFKEIGLLDNKSVLIRSQNRFNFWKNFINGDLFYEASTQSTARLEKVFVRVQYGEGNYKYLGDLNSNAIADENEFVQDIYEGDYILMNLPTSKLFPVVNLKTSTRWKIDFAKIMKSNNSLFAKILTPISTETVYRIDEYSEAKNIADVLLLKPNVLMSDSTTLRGANSLQQDLFLFKNKPDLSFRFRYIENNKLTQYNTGNELGYFSERALRIRFQMVKEISNQTDFINQTDNNSSVNNARARILAINELTSDFSYRPIQNIEIGFKIGVGNSTDNLPAKVTKIENNMQLVRVTYSFTNKGRIKIEAERNEVSDNGTGNLIPYEMLRGKVVGKNYFWRVNFDYRLAENLQITLNYLGRKQAESKIVHNLRTEARAYF
ncbi:MAG: hypothetical protein COW71_13310 [Ignavibacteriales bacterium CG18_big_fil_WC_8_21_14_2_50_31_20]|nr:MAG: hypothetical protein COW71_13310 [Ignavibacteriales bacterium CG18_big_fil_WC_8_21_14_2_50_31_20]